ncbi:MAG: hypothetical protein RLZZ262_37, partial [Bacteroidota bacterium]
MKAIGMLMFALLSLYSVAQKNNGFAIAIECETELQQVEGILNQLQNGQNGSNLTKQITGLSQRLMHVYEMAWKTEDVNLRIRACILSY